MSVRFLWISFTVRWRAFETNFYTQKTSFHTQNSFQFFHFFVHLFCDIWGPLLVYAIFSLQIMIQYCSLIKIFFFSSYNIDRYSKNHFQCSFFIYLLYQITLLMQPFKMFSTLFQNRTFSIQNAYKHIFSHLSHSHIYK